MRTSLYLGSIAGIRIEVNFSWLIIFALMTFSLATLWFPQTVSGQPVALYWITAVVAVLLLFASVLAHELAHSIVAKSRGMPVKSITLFIFGGVSNIEREPQSPGAEFQMAFVGPLTSLIIGGVSLGLALILANITGVPPLLTSLVGYLGWINLALGVFNLIPGFPMDGGRVLRSMIWKATGSLQRATQWAANIGQGIAYLMMLVGVWLFFAGFPLDGLWVGFIGLFLLYAAQSEINQMRLESSVAGVKVGDVMTATPVVSPYLSAQQFVDEHLLRTGQRAMPVVDDVEGGRLLGIVTLRDVRRLPREQWATTPIGQIMTPLAQLKTVDASQPLAEALPLITQAGVNQLPVVRDGRLVGILGLEAIIERMQVRQELGLGARSAPAARERREAPGEPVGPRLPSAS